VRHVVTFVLTAIFLILLGMVLKWAWNTGNWWVWGVFWFVFLPGITWATWRPEDTDGAKEMWSDIKAKFTGRATRR